MNTSWAKSQESFISVNTECGSQEGVSLQLNLCEPGSQGGFPGNKETTKVRPWTALKSMNEGSMTALNIERR